MKRDRKYGKEAKQGKREVKWAGGVVVTGMGAITPIGLSVDEFWDSVKQGKIGFDTITKFDASEYKCQLAAEVKGFEGKNYMDFKAAKRMELLANMRWQQPRRQWLIQG